MASDTALGRNGAVHVVDLCVPARRGVAYNNIAMSAKDKVHQQVVNALKKDGWTITQDPFKVRWKTLRKTY